MQWYENSQKSNNLVEDLEVFKCDNNHTFWFTKKLLLQRKDQGLEICPLCDGYETIEDYRNYFLGRKTTKNLEDCEIMDPEMVPINLTQSFVFICDTCFEYYNDKIGVSIRTNKCKNCRKFKETNLCMYENCANRAYYSIPGKKLLIACKDEAHREKLGAITRKLSRPCKFCEDNEACLTTLNGFPTCAKCRDKHNLIATDTKSSRCIICKKLSNYNIINKTTGDKKSRILCGKKECHDQYNLNDNEEIRIDKPPCKCGRLRQPIFNFPDMTRGICCDKCKEPGMINIKRKYCKFTDCISTANYNFPNKPGEYCAKHIKDGMILINCHKCQHFGCEKRAAYNWREKSRIPILCKNHKLNDMKTTHNVSCQFNECKRYATYGDPEDVKRKRIYCRIHAENLETGFINVQNKMCETCHAIQATYNYQKPPKFCRGCAEDDMIDVRNSRCRKKDCLNRVRYGKLGKNKTRCKTHTEENMLEYPKAVCLYCEHKRYATHAQKGIRKPDKCYDCAKDDNRYLSLITEKCVNENDPEFPYCMGIDVLNDFGKCEACDPINSRFRINGKELVVRNALIQSGFILNKDFKHDRVLPNSKEYTDHAIRPDFIFHVDDTYFIIIEVDEHQHRSYECEINRMIYMYQCMDFMSGYIVRFNPDKYTVNDIVQNPDLESRTARLIEILRQCLKERPKHKLLYQHLYYNEYDDKNEFKNGFKKLI